MRFGHITIDGRLYKDMLKISASTIDRMLKFDRQSMLPYGKTLTKPGTLLKSQIPVRRGCDWTEYEVGFNDHLLTYCKEEDLVFTRGRPNTKNDDCFVEEKNWSVVRRFSGYYRFEGQDCTDILNMMYDLLALYINYFMPSQKLISKTRDGAHVSRKHDDDLSPYRRIMANKSISSKTKTKLTEIFNSLDVYQLRREIARLQDVLKRKAVPNG